MLKDLEKGNWIIPPWDPRYGKLGHIWKKWNYWNISDGSGSSMIYKIPKELVLRDYITSYSIVSNREDSFVNRSMLAKVVDYSLGLTVQDFFDLIVLNINDISNRPRCTYCKSPLIFSNRFIRGYNSSSPWFDFINHYCDHFCEGRFLAENPQLYEYKTYQITKMVYGREIVRYDTAAETVLYIVDTGSCYKFGMSSNMDSRSYYVGGNYHILLSSNRLEIANIEATLKLRLDTRGSEYIDYNRIHEFFINLKEVLKIRPVPNPFEQD